MLVGVVSFNVLKVMDPIDPRALGVLLVGYFFQGLSASCLSCIVTNQFRRSGVFHDLLLPLYLRYSVCCLPVCSSAILIETLFSVMAVRPLHFLNIIVIHRCPSQTGFLEGHQANGAFVACGPPGFTALALIRLADQARTM